MTARCASCSYPLTISDSVVCYECTSYFHIDCAQLVGFPVYPQRNTFHCSTCKLLPLPRPADNDSDSDCEDAMPSRQLDYAPEDRSDYSNDMNEVKGSVQDLSSLCKDMIREMNELKSINLTLRCSVENLRHDNNRSNGVIADLTRRIEALERNRWPKGSLESNDWSLDSVVLEKEEELERYSTPEPPEVVRNENQPARISYSDNATHPYEALLKDTAEESKLTKNISCNEDNYEIEEKILNTGHMSESVRETALQDWTWKGHDAVEIKNVEFRHTDDRQQKNTEGSSENWKDDAAEEEFPQHEEYVEKQVEEFKSLNNNNDEEEEEEEDYDDESEEEKTQYEIGEIRRIKRNVDTGDDMLDGKNENCQEGEDTNEVTGRELSDNWEDEQKALEVRTELGSEVESIATLDERELNERLLGEGLTSIEESLPRDERPEDHEHEHHLTEDTSHGSDWDPADGEHHDRVGDIHDEEECELGDSETRLEAEAHPDGETAEAVEGEVEYNGEENPEKLEVDDQAPVPADGGVEIVEPPAEPQHTEADLWDYLKDTVSSVHPHTVEEFLENLIGTLQHVPEEYFKPVIAANIRRATSPSVTDGEHLTSHEGNHEEGTAAESVLERQDNQIEGEYQELPGEAVAPTESQEEGYTSIEGAVLGGFWVVWVVCTLWGK